MKIAVWHNLPSGGGKRALYYHVRGLVQRGHHVEAWCPPTADPSYLPLGELIPEHTVPFDWKSFEGRFALTRAIASYRNVVDKLRAMDRHCRACADQMSRGSYDVLFGNSCQLFRVTSIGRFMGIPRVLYLQEPYRWLYEAIPELPWLALPEPPEGRYSINYLKRFIRNLIQVQGLRVQAREEQLNARAFDTILVNSHFSRESVLRAYGLDAQVCYLGVDTDLFVNHSNRREGFLLGLGALVPEKRADLIINAVARLTRPRPKVVWVANVAITSHRQHLQQLAASADVDFTVHIGIPDKQVVDLLNRAALLVYGPRLEPFGLALLEAAACGLPVVAVAEGGVRETVVDGVNGLLVEDDPEAVARAIQRLLADPVYASQLGAAGCDLVARRWTLSASVDRLEQRLIEAVRAPRGG